MKNSILYLLLVSLFLFSCGDFLEEKPKDKIIPETAEDYSEFLYGEAYLKDKDALCVYLDVMSDDCECFGNVEAYSWNPDTRNFGFGYYTWQTNPEQTLEGALYNDYTWETLYHSILICNIVLAEIGDVDGKTEIKEDIMAEAHFIRAFDYFMLVNLYGLPYRKETADKDMGVPISNIVGMEDKYFERSSVADVYKQIESDLNESIRLFESSGISKNYFRANKNAANLLASRVALYQGKYDEVIKFSSEVIENHSSLWDLNEAAESDYFISKKNPEILFSFASAHSPFYNNYAQYCFPQSADLLSKFIDGDLREEFFMPSSTYGIRIPIKNTFSSDSQVFGYAFRSAEAYLNRAEAYAANAGTIAKAMDDVNYLREHRFSNKIDLDANTVEQAIRKVREERRRELCFEQHRWFDLRRYGCPRIEHVYVENIVGNVTSTYVLEENDPAYTLPIPFTVFQFRPGLGNVSRPERNPL